MIRLQNNKICGKIILAQIRAEITKIGETTMSTAENTKPAAQPIFKRLAEVTVVQLKIEKNVEYFVKIVGPIHLGAAMPDKVNVDPKTGEVTREAVKPAHIVHVVDLVENAPRQIVLSSVMVSELERGYPNEGYVGRCIGFVDLGKLNGKAYNSIQIWEVEEPEGVIEMRVAGGVGGVAKASAQEPNEGGDPGAAQEGTVATEAAPAAKAQGGKKK
jgi:hypothetical protein